MNTTHSHWTVVRHDTIISSCVEHKNDNKKETQIVSKTTNKRRRHELGKAEDSSDEEI